MSFIIIIPLLANVAITAICRLVTYPLRTVRAPTLHKDVLFAAVRSMLRRMTIAQSRYLNPSTSARYLSLHCTKKGVNPATITLQTTNGPVDAHWIGDPDAEAVILYLHGGGYTQPANEGNFLWLQRLVQDLESEGEKRRSVSVLMLAYTLVPEAVYPTQLREATAALSHLIVATQRHPSNVFIAGDSAGGNLALSLISHLAHPHPEVPEVVLQVPLAGVVLISPWVSFRTDHPSFGNEELDMLVPNVLRKWSAMFLGKADPQNPERDPGPVVGDCWTDVCGNEAQWWEELDRVVGDVLVWYGSVEVFRDAIREFEGKLRAGWVESGGDSERVKFIEETGAAHIGPIVDTMIVKRKGSSQEAIEEWFVARLEE